MSVETVAGIGTVCQSFFCTCVCVGFVLRQVISFGDAKRFALEVDRFRSIVERIDFRRFVAPTGFKSAMLLLIPRSLLFCVQSYAAHHQSKAKQR